MNDISAKQQNLRKLVHDELTNQRMKVQNTSAMYNAINSDKVESKTKVINASVAMTKEKRPDRRSAVDRVASKPRHWLEEEDELLRAAVAHYGNKHWKKIAERVPGRNHTQCLQRWSKVLAPGLKKGQWSASEDGKLIALAKEQLEMCKNADSPDQKKKLNWGLISKQITGRTAKQCRERWVNNLNPDIRKGGWTPEEDQKILELYDLFPKKWAMISKNLEGRTENAVKIRYKSLTRNAPKKQVPGIPQAGQQVLKNQALNINNPSSSQVSEYSKLNGLEDSLISHSTASNKNASHSWTRDFVGENEQTSQRIGVDDDFASIDLFSPSIMNLDNAERHEPAHQPMADTRIFGTRTGEMRSYTADARSTIEPKGYNFHAAHSISSRQLAEQSNSRSLNYHTSMQQHLGGDYIRRMDELSFEGAHSSAEPEPQPSPHQMRATYRENRLPGSTFDYYHDRVEEMEKNSKIEKKRKPQNKDFNSLRQVMSGELQDFEVGDAVEHEVRGRGTVLEFDLNNRRGKPYKVRFNNGETHEYSIVQVREKLKKCSIANSQGSRQHFESSFGRNANILVHDNTTSFGRKHEIGRRSSKTGIGSYSNESWTTENKTNNFLSDQSLNNFELQQLIELDDSEFDALYSQQPIKF